MTEYEQIVEFCYIPKQENYVIRFLSGECYTLKVTDLPKKMQTKSPDWENAVLSQEKNYILVTAGKELRQIACHVIHSKGKLL